jgi:hypothetical protein
MEVAIERIIKSSRLNHGDIVGSKQNAENFKKSVQHPTRVVVL